MYSKDNQFFINFIKYNIILFYKVSFKKFLNTYKTV